MNQIHKAAQNRERERERVETETATVDVDIPDLTGKELAPECSKMAPWPSGPRMPTRSPDPSLRNNNSRYTGKVM